MTFELFKGNYPPREPRLASLDSSGAIILGPMPEADLPRDKRLALLYFDSETSRMAVQLIKHDSCHAYRVWSMTNRKGGFLIIGGGDFLEHHKILFPQRRLHVEIELFGEYDTSGLAAVFRVKMGMEATNGEDAQ